VVRSSQRWRFGDGGELALIRFDGWKKSGVVNSPVEGTVVYPVHYLQWFHTSKRWLALGFLNHQQQQETDSRFNCGGEGSGFCLSIPKEKPVTQKTNDD